MSRPPIIKQSLDPILGVNYNVSIANPFLGGHLYLNGRVKYKQWCSLQVCTRTLFKITAPVKVRRPVNFNCPPFWTGLSKRPLV